MEVKVKMTVCEYFADEEGCVRNKCARGWWSRGAVCR
jgi:hypothetical protein